MQGYQLIDSGNFEKLEQVGGFRLRRQALSAVWAPKLGPSEWSRVDAEFERQSDGGGDWKMRNSALKDGWSIQMDGITFNMKLTSFGHLGIFPEQHDNWLRLEKICKARTEKGLQTSVMNLFAYTGGSTLFCARGGAEVVHVDASKGTVNWAGQNSKDSGLAEAKTRWIVDDVKEFVKRELRRGNKYQGFILDPPSYGRGSGKNQIWKIETDLMPLLADLKALAADDLAFVLLSSHTPGYTPISLRNQLSDVFGSTGEFLATEMLIEEKSGRYLPSGTACLLTK